MNGFWNWFWLVFLSFAFIAYVFAMLSIVIDLFRDGSVSGWMKAVWLFFLLVFPIITALVYLGFRGDGMAERTAGRARAQRAAQDEYIRSAAQTSPADQVAQAKQLLDSGVITQQEFETLKAKALT